MLGLLVGPPMILLLWVIFLLVYYKRRETKFRFGVQELLFLPLALIPATIAVRKAIVSPEIDVIFVATLLLTYQITGAAAGWLTMQRRYPRGGWVPASAMVVAAWVSTLPFYYCFDLLKIALRSL